MKRAFPIIIIVLLLLNLGVKHGARYAGIAAGGGGKPVAAVVIRETDQQNKLTSAQVKWMMSPKLRADAKAAGIPFEVHDPDVKDKTGKTPEHLEPIIVKAKEGGLPKLVIKTSSGLVVYDLPATDSDARKLILGE